MTSRTEANCNHSNSKTIIKPQQSPYTLINISNAFDSIRKMQTENYSYYGLPNSTKYDIHMIKGNEWGSVTYLSQSIYGKYGNTAYEGADKEVYANIYKKQNTTAYLLQTGCSSGSTTAIDRAICYLYNDIENNREVGASTTGNITGVYDMSGGALEWTMEFVKGQNGINLGISGFSNLPDMVTPYLVTIHFQQEEEFLP